MASNSIRVMRCFVNADLRRHAPGLIFLLEEEGIYVETLPVGTLFAFINSNKTFIKILACNESPQPVVASYRLPHGRIYDLRVIGEIPKAFRGGRVDFDAALKKVIDKHFKLTPPEKKD